MKNFGILALLFVGIGFFGVSALADDGLGDQVLIDGPEVDLTMDDLRKVLAAMPEEVRAQTVHVSSKLRKVMDQTYMTKVAAHRALAHGLGKDPGVIAKVENYRRNVLAAAEVRRATATELPSAEGYLDAARELYQARGGKYQVPERVKVRHILLKGKDSEQDSEVLERARQLRQQIVTGKLDFKLAATRYSEDSATARVGGALKPFSRGRMVKPFEDAAFALEKEGEISGPVKTKFGYHLIQLVKRLPAHRVPFDKVKDELIKEVREKSESRANTEYWLKIRDDPAIKLNEPLIEKMLSEPEKVLAPEKG